MTQGALQAADLPDAMTAPPVAEAPPPAVEGVPPPAAEPTPEEAAAAEAAAAETAAAEAKAAAVAANRAELQRIAAEQRDRLMTKKRLKAQSEALARDRQGYEADRKAAAELREQLAAEKANAAKWRADPLAFARESGVTPEQLVSRIVKDGTPEAAIEQLRAELASERAARADYEKKIAERFQADEAAKKEATERAQAEHVTQIQIRAADNFVAMCAASSEAFPTLAALAEAMPHVVIAEAKQVAAGVLKWNRENPDRAETYSDQEIAAHIEERLKPVYTKLTGGKVPTAVASQGQGSSAVSAGSAKQAPKTLSNSAQAERSATEIDLSKMSRHEQNAALAAIYDKHIAARQGATSPRGNVCILHASRREGRHYRPRR